MKLPSSCSTGTKHYLQPYSLITSKNQSSIKPKRKAIGGA